jgi:hypothetical protein
VFTNLRGVERQSRIGTFRFFLVETLDRPMPLFLPRTSNFRDALHSSASNVV